MRIVKSVGVNHLCAAGCMIKLRSDLWWSDFGPPRVVPRTHFPCTGRLRRPIGTFYLLAPKLVFHKLRSRQIDHPYEDAYDLFVPHGRASHERASHGHMS